MIKQKWGWAVLLVLLLIASVGLYQRWDVETTNKPYEMVVPYEELKTLTNDSTFTVDEVLSRLKKAGLTSVSLNPMTLVDLDNQGTLSIYTDKMLTEMFRFSDEDVQVPKVPGYYITIPEVEYYEQVILDGVDPEKRTIAGEVFYFLPKDSDKGLNTFLGYDETVLNEITDHGLTYVLRMDNAEDFDQEAMDLVLQAHNGNTNILFHGEEVIGFPELGQMNEWTRQLHEAGSSFHMIEFAKQHGFQTLARNTDYDIIRLHSIDLNQKTLDESANQVVRAVKERNIRSIFFHLTYGDPEESLEYAEEFLTEVQGLMPGGFQLGNAQPYEKISVLQWHTLVVLLAGILFTYLAAARIWKWWSLSAVAGLGMALLALLYIVLDRLVILQGFALLIAIITPIYAVLASVDVGDNRLRDVTIQYVKAIAISLAGIMIVVGLLNGNAFITGMEIFRGVKLVYVLPIAFVGIYLFWQMAYRILRENGVRLLNAEVKYWHLLVFLVIAAIGLYYVSRTGNAGTASDIELLIRNKLEEWLYVRPRTKEFLIGFPSFVVALYVRPKNKLIGNLLLIPGTIGFLSIVNTFTHFHIPLYISLLRTFYSIVIGYFIGLLLIFIVRKLVIRFRLSE
ncbi:DUF5693 family protein [Oceanobacillus sp. Castelsardo]|uniref:DUF5693 family protein n=1 Tax=Oceanobacillus sp. Castelsardo TaxID=1851204 RepID=UPI000837D39F|nr:DUF5693 family protein [Oceanobacillus sp. Castelsardo]